MRIGIPRALLFHRYGDGWLAFLDEVGVEAVVSPETTDLTIALGADNADNESCLPVKVFTGHLLSLAGETDAVLVPRVLSEGPRMTSCPKYIGLPDMAGAVAPRGTRILTPEMDLGDMRGDWRRDWLELARGFGAERSRASAALRRMLEAFAENSRPNSVSGADGSSVGIAGHWYNLADGRVSLDLLGRIEAMGARTVTVEQVPRAQVKRQLKTLHRKIRWDFESTMVGAVLHWVRTRSVSGIIHVNSFACGPGSMIGALLEDEISLHGEMPYLSITLDEHASETGMLTRVEAFLDMLERAPRSRSSGAGHQRPPGSR